MFFSDLAEFILALTKKNGTMDCIIWVQGKG